MTPVRPEATPAPIPQIDAVTGLPGRTAILRSLRVPGYLAQRQPMVLLAVGLDRFRLINEVLGDAAGDEVLAAVADRLRAWTTAGRAAARIGADEFLLVGPCDSAFQARAMAEAVRDLLAAPFVVDGWDRPVHVTACLGVATSDPSTPGDAPTLIQLFRAATEALHDAKRDGAGVVEWFDEHRHDERRSQFRLANDLPDAVARDEFRLVYQPIVSLESVRPLSVEALLRWHHPELGLVMPSRFIPLAEATGRIDAIGRMVLRMACEQVVTWRRHLPDVEVPAVSVNVAPRQFEAADFVDEVDRHLAVTGVDPQHLMLELTEGTLVRDPVRTQVVLNDLRRIGVRVAVDDFGTGHSSLAYIKRLPVDVLKIDRTFVADVDADHRDQAVVGAVVGLAEALNLRTVAEGVETRGQLEELRRLGCEQGQGFYWSPPVAPEDIEPWFSGRMVSLAPRRALDLAGDGGPDLSAS